MIGFKAVLFIFVMPGGVMAVPDPTGYIHDNKPACMKYAERVAFDIQAKVIAKIGNATVIFNCIEAEDETPTVFEGDTVG